MFIYFKMLSRIAKHGQTLDNLTLSNPICAEKVVTNARHDHINANK